MADHGPSQLGITPPLPVIRGAWSMLRPISSADIPLLHHWHALPSERPSEDLSLGSLESFAQTYPAFIGGGSIALVLDSTGIPVGFLRTDRWNEWERHCILEIFVPPTNQDGHPAIREALALFLDYLFRTRRCRLVSTHSWDDDRPRRELLRWAGFEQTCVDSEYYRRWPDQYVDRVHMDVTAAAWPDHRQRLLTSADLSLTVGRAVTARAR